MQEQRSNEEFLLEIIKTAVDFNTQIMTVLTAEISGDLSGRNRTHQRTVLSRLQLLSNTYSQNLESMFQHREAELRSEDAKNEFSDEIRSAIRKTIALLDKKMQLNPSRELADTSNYLEGLLTADELPKEEVKS